MTWSICVILLASFAYGLGIDVDYVRIRSIRRRSVDGLERIHVRAFGQDHHLLLEPAEILSPAFHAITIRSFENKDWTESSGPLDALQSGQFYSVLGGRGSVYMNKRDVLTMEGILDDELTIAPHVNKRSPNDTATHVIYRYPQKDVIVDDIRYPNISIPDDDTPIDTRQSAPSKVTVEVLAVLDYRNSKALNFDTNKLARYLGVFWNSVSRIYSDLKDPQVEIVVSGMVVTRDSKDEPYINKNMHGSDGVTDKMLGDFRVWVSERESSLPKHDAAMIHTALDTGSINNGQWNTGLAGLAYMGTACSNNGYETGFIEDTVPDYTGVKIGAHELAHTLNVPHDGDSSSCPNDGYVMSGALGNSPNSWKFSSCSQTAMRSFLKSAKGSCTYNQPTTVVSKATDLLFYESGTLDDLCRERFGSPNVFGGTIEPGICRAVWCKIFGNNQYRSVGGALEGTPCDVGKVCLGETCNANIAPSLDTQCVIHFGSGWSAVDKTSSSVCRNLQCSNKRSRGSAGTAAAGSMCGNYGICKKGECIMQATSLDDQCKHKFGSTYHSYTDGDACKALKCTENNGGWKSFGGADAASTCASGKICRDGQCAAR